jgi:hypothetical protein
LPASALHKFTDFLPAMPYSLPYFYGSLRKVKTVENARRGVAMKEFLKGALLTVVVLALVLGIRFAAFFPRHSEAMAMKDPAPIAAADRGLRRAASENAVLATRR